MIVFFDTNVLVASVATQGVCAELMSHCLENHTCITSDAVIAELKAALAKKFRLAPSHREDIIRFFKSQLLIVKTPTAQQKICRDADDDKIIAAAQSTDADCIITGDKDLLILMQYQGLVFISPKRFWAYESAQADPADNPS